MRGLITEKHWEQIEKTFPGICAYYDCLVKKREMIPHTFLDLEQDFLDKVGKEDSTVLDDYFGMSSWRETHDQRGTEEIL